MKKDYAHLGIVVDRSGSMIKGWEETVAGVKRYIEENKTFGEATVSVYVFDSTIDRLLHFVDIKSITEDVLADVKPRDMTRLFDAFCVAIDETGTELSTKKEEDRPDQVIMLVLTDGDENASQEFNLDAVRSRIKEQQEKYGWKFVFLGADFSVDTYASQFGLSKSNSRNVGKADLSASLAYTGAAVKSYRSGKFAAAFDADMSELGT